MSRHLIIDGNAVYEVDEDCMEQKESMYKDRMQKVRMQKDGTRKDGICRDGTQGASPDKKL